MYNQLPKDCIVLDKTKDGKFIIGHRHAMFCAFEAHSWTRAIQKARYHLGFDETLDGGNSHAEVEQDLADILTTKKEI